jgi:hypothetical protein
MGFWARQDVRRFPQRLFFARREEAALWQNLFG